MNLLNFDRACVADFGRGGNSCDKCQFQAHSLRPRSGAGLGCSGLLPRMGPDSAVKTLIYFSSHRVLSRCKTCTALASRRSLVGPLFPLSLFSFCFPPAFSSVCLFGRGSMRSEGLRSLVLIPYVSCPRTTGLPFREAAHALDASQLGAISLGGRKTVSQTCMETRPYA